MSAPHRSPRAAHVRASRAGGAVLAAVLTFGGVAGCTSDDTTLDAGPTSDASVPAPDTSVATTPDATAPTTPAAEPSSAATGSSSGDGSAPGQASEVLPTQTPGPAGLPVTAAPGPTLTGKLPKTGNANGKVVKGFPTGVVPIPRSLTVVSTSVSASGNRLQVGLQASSDSKPASVKAAYVAALSKAGFAVSDSPALPGTTAVAFTHGPDGLVLTLRKRTGGGTELSVAGTLTTAG
ncbi:MAG TPA: hypothetical protein VNR62_02125 [Cellulomonas sp.]|nr:hypothetical protein [Cellulomonas sp.]